jgi:hypothetical protein
VVFTLKNLLGEQRFNSLDCFLAGGVLFSHVLLSIWFIKHILNCVVFTLKHLLGEQRFNSLDCFLAGGVRWSLMSHVTAFAVCRVCQHDLCVPLCGGQGDLLGEQRFNSLDCFLAGGLCG